MNLPYLIENLKNYGFTVSIFATAKEATAYLTAQIIGTTVGMGGSKTLESLGLYEQLTATNTVYWHWRDKNPDVLRCAACTQVYLTSANAIAETGEIVNIDGNGNRIAASLFGHKTLYVIAGTNKIVKNLEMAIWRARNIAAPLNAKRLQRHTPCATALDMRCYDCRSAERICKGMTILYAPMSGIEHTEIILVDEVLGY